MGKFAGRLFPESPVRPTLVVFTALSLRDLLSFRQPREPIGIQAFYPTRSHDTAGSFAQNTDTVSGAESMPDVGPSSYFVCDSYISPRANASTLGSILIFSPPCRATVRTIWTLESDFGFRSLGPHRTRLREFVRTIICTIIFEGHRSR
jgi:hypothetical protein